MKVRRLLASRGMSGIPEELTARLKYRLSRRLRTIPYPTFRALEWDRRRGVETEQRVQVRGLVADGASREEPAFYMATTIWRFREVMVALQDQGVRPPEFSVVDYGCGKGRVLMMAAEAGFGAVVGVEFAPELARIAAENLRSWSDHGLGCRPAIFCCDAATFPIPMGPVVLFIVNPFTGPVLETVANNIARSFNEHLRSMYIVYLVPRQDSPFGRGAPFVQVEAGPECAIFRLTASSLK
jgi:hypothetical protein